MSVNKRLINTGGGVDIGFTTWTKVQQMTGAGAASGNQTNLTYAFPYYLLADYTSSIGYRNDGSSFTNMGITSGAHGLFYAFGACLTDTNLYVIKGAEPSWPNNAYWKTAQWYGSSMSTYTTVSGPTPTSGDLAFADVDGTGGYIYQVLSNASPNTTVRKYNPSNLNSYTDITLASPLNNSSSPSSSTLFFDGVGWCVVYMNGTITWATVKFSPDFQQLWVSEQGLGSYGGYQIGYILSSSTLVGANTVYLKGEGSDKVQQFTLS